MKPDQAAKLRVKVKNAFNHNHAKTVAVVSGKGGVGKSNIALNFSLSLTQKGKKVLLFDLDIGMGNIDILLGRSSKHSIIKMFEYKLPIYDIIEPGPNALSYVAGGNAQENIFQLDGDKLDYFLEQLELLLNDYDYIVFDLGAGVTRETIHYILAVDECLVVTTPEPTALTDAYSMVKHILSHQSISLNLILNRVPSKRQGDVTMNRIIIAVKRFLNHDIFPLGQVPDDRDVTTAVLNQKPFLLDSPKAKASEAIDRITNQFLGELPTNERRGSGFLSKIKQFMTER